MNIEDVKIGLIVINKTTKVLYKILDIPIIISRKHYTKHKAVYYKENKTNQTYVDTIHTFAEEFNIVNHILSERELIDFTL